MEDQMEDWENEEAKEWAAGTYAWRKNPEDSEELLDEDESLNDGDQEDSMLSQEELSPSLIPPDLWDEEEDEIEDTTEEPASDLLDDGKESPGLFGKIDENEDIPSSGDDLDEDENEDEDEDEDEDWSLTPDLNGMQAPGLRRHNPHPHDITHVNHSNWKHTHSHEMDLQNARQIVDYARSIADMIPTGQGLVEHFLAVSSSNISDVAHSLRYSPGRRMNPKHKYMAKANASHIAEYAEAIVQHLESGSHLEDWMKSKLSSVADRLDSVLHAAEFKQDYALNPIDSNDFGYGQEVAERIFSPGGLKRRRSRKNPCGRRHKQPRRRNTTEAAWGGPLYRRRRRRNATEAAWGGPLYRRNGLRRRRNATEAAWGEPLYRRNRRNPRKRRNATEAAWGGPLYRRNRRNPRKRRNATETAWGGPLYRKKHSRRRNPRGVWGEDLYGAGPGAWGGPLYRKKFYRRNG